MRKILFAASEAVPFIKTGGLADVVGALPKYIDRKKYDVRIILPKYLAMEEEIQKKLHFMTHVYVDLGWRKQYAGIFEAIEDGIIYYFIDNEFYFAGSRPYGQVYEDVEKFAFFSKAVLKALPKLNFRPDLIHCHDWQTGLIPVYLKEIYQMEEYYRGIKTVFSIHNLKFQGRWTLKTVKDITGLPESVYTSGNLEAYGESNYLKGGVVYADAVTTVSRTYALEIMTPEGGEGLDGLMRSVSGKLFGILNGIDYALYNPGTDINIPVRYDVHDFTEGKAKNKKALIRELGLEGKPGVFLLGMVSRMTGQKGFDLLAYTLEELLGREAVQMVVLGTGEEQYENMFRYFQTKYPDKISARLSYSEEAAHRIYAACDGFLMPSMFEPCGLSQLISLRYGTVPIVRETGGLLDTVEPYNEYSNTGTGFSFRNYNAEEMMHVLRYALKVYYSDSQAWKELITRGMKKNFSWGSSAVAYDKLYEAILLEKLR